MKQGTDISAIAVQNTDHGVGPGMADDIGSRPGVAPPAAAKTGNWRRWLVPAVLLGALVAAAWSGGYSLLTLETIASLHHRFHAIIADYAVLSLFVYVIAYAGLVALSVPSASLLTLAGGLFFGAFAGGAAAVVSASLGAVGLFTLTRLADGDGATRRFWPQVATLQDGFKRHAFFYMLSLRLVPVIPFCIVNIVPALLGVPLRTFFWGTLIGIIPASFAISSVGAGLDQVIAKASEQQAACVMAHVALVCPLQIDAGSLMTPKLGIAFAVLSLLALLPVGVKHWRQRHGR